MDKRILAFSIAAFGLGWAAGRMTAKRPELEDIIQRLDAEQGVLATLELRTRAIETGSQARPPLDRMRPATTRQSSLGHDQSAIPSPALTAPAGPQETPQETPQSLAAKDEGERLLTSAISAGVWTRKDELQFQRALVRMLPDARFEMMKRQTIAINNQQLSGR